MGKQPDQEDINVAREALEVLTVSLALCPAALENTLVKEKAWQNFIIDLLLLCKSRLVCLTFVLDTFSMNMWDDKCCQEIKNKRVMYWQMSKISALCPFQLSTISAFFLSGHQEQAHFIVSFYQK